MPLSEFDEERMQNMEMRVTIIAVDLREFALENCAPKDFARKA